MTVEERTSKGAALYEKIHALSVYGANAVMRRVLTLVRREFDLPDEVRGRRCRPDVNGACRPDHCLAGSFSFEDSVREYQQDDRRRSVFVDPQEAITASLIDYLSDRLEVLELRVGDRQLDLDEAERRAVEQMRASYPLVSVSHFLAESTEGLVAALRTTAFAIEKRSTDVRYRRMLAEASIFQDEATRQDKCEFIRTETGPVRWLDNGHTLQQSTRAVFSCRSNDGCCGNAAYTKFGTWQWTTVWSDSGDPSQPPPTNPPSYQNEPWDNYCALFPSPVVGTITSDYGWRTIGGALDFHPGLDIGVPPGTQVLSHIAGEIVHLNHSGAEGGVIVRAGNRVYQFWHVDVLVGLSVGDPVAAGQAIGTVAQRPGPHLHLAVFDPPNGDWTKKADDNSLRACRP